MKRIAGVALIVLAASSAFAGKRIEQGTIKDLQATNFAVAKKMHQQYDFFIDTSARTYSCRTPEKKKINATEFVVGSTVTFTSSGRNGEVRTSQGKSAGCMITRVSDLASR